MPSLLVFKFTPIAQDARVLRQLDVFRDRYEVTTTGFGPRVDGAVEHIELPIPAQTGLGARLRAYAEAVLLRLRWYRLMLWTDPVVRSAWRRLRGREWERALVNDLETIPIVLRLLPAARIHADLHEYFPGVHDDHPDWVRLRKPYYEWLVETYATRVASVTTVADGLAERYARHGLAARVVTNAPPAQAIDPSPVHDPIRLVHSGNATPARRLERTMRAVARAHAEVTLTLYLMPNDEKHLAELMALADRLGPRVRILAPVPQRELVATLAQYDVGVFVLPPETTNHALALPNKFFDYVQARLGLLIGPSPEMAALLTRHGLGVVTTGFAEEDIVAAIESLRPAEIAGWKRASDAAALELSADRQSAVWVEVVEALSETPR